ncbi:MAG: hypothetical protein EBX76_05355 [Acidimicrobiia bacterium]|nr:hypothetical protein [Acidimicrobiia bacterium]
MTRTIAAIDIGSNSTNLLITDELGAQLVREVNVTALGEGVARTNVLSPAASERTLAVIRRYATVVAQHNAELHITGTAACRMASNTNDFFAQVHAATGVEPRLLSAPSSALTSVSLPFGVVTLTEAELHSDPPRAEELSNAVSMVGDAVDNAAIEHPQLAGAQRVVGVAGSIVTIAAVELGLQQFDAARLHGMVLTKSAAEDVFRTLATERLADRVHNPGLPVERAGVIVGGCCLLVAIMRRLHLDHIIVSTHNLLDGVVAEARASRGHNA